MNSSIPEVYHGGRFAGDRIVGAHSHPGVELILVTDGKCRTTVGDQCFEGRIGTLHILPPGVPQEQEGSVCTTYITFSPMPSFFDNQARILQLGNGDPLFIWIEQAVDLVNHPAENASNIQDALMLTIITRIKHLEKRRDSVSHLHPAVRQALEILDREFDSSLCCDDLARRVGLSTSHLSALFRKQMSSSLLQWQLRLRLRKAETLLGNHRLQVNEISRTCGFSDPNYFIRCFRRQYNVSPGQWRAGARVVSRDE